MKREPASTLKKIPQAVMLNLTPKNLPTFNKKIVKATEILENNDKISHESLKPNFINIHLIQIL